MANRRIFYKGTAEFSHYCGAGWRSHVSSIIVEQVSPRMGVIVESDGGGPYSGSKRQSYYVDGAAAEEVGKKVQLSRVISDNETAAKLYEMRGRELRKKNPNYRVLEFIYVDIAQHPSFAGFKPY